ncbi:beta-1,3-galactosyltransferase 5 [Venturia canescens]|uniref:beta-1,3-galactosyltransferase 5 n=1 Tax=Venturia canescens TaxID=32260 RepID=UPI001C9CCAFD|nr:beta-1,3-galactosyltransferase 5 [Venturia canescens]XP_043285085.1 beta-1,3-galactosyltransferase 5 [Venturia canescens]
MSRFIKFFSILVLCIVTFLIFVRVVEKSKIVSEDRYSSLKPKSLSSKKLLTLENFEYTIVPSHCNGTLLAWIVTSFAGDVGPRSALRRAYGSDELRELGITRVFLLGMLDESGSKKSGVTESAIRNEAERFDDIVQGNFNEAYRNLTYKHLMGLKWASDNCANARYIVKQDDDIVVNLYEILNKLKSFANETDVFGGYVLRGMKAVREPANKWYVEKDEYEGDTYPDFLSGWLYFISRRIAAILVQHSNTCKKYFWIDDVFITGILRHELNIPLIDFRHFYATDYRFLHCCIEGVKKNLKCEFAVGPNGGKTELQVDFQNYAAFCQNHCELRKPRNSVGKTCVVEYEKSSNVGIGSAQINPLEFT